MPAAGVTGRKFAVLDGLLDERGLRLVAAAEALAAGHGGVSAVARASGLSRGAVARGIAELRLAGAASGGMAANLTGKANHVNGPVSGVPVRRRGAGRKRTAEHDPTLRRDLAALAAPASDGGAENPLCWTRKSVRQLAGELSAMGHRTSHRMVAELLHEMDYSLQARRKIRDDGGYRADDAQFQFINGRIREFQAARQPVIAVDADKKEFCGGTAPESGRTPAGRIRELVTRGAGWVRVGSDRDTSALAAQSVRQWWESMGKAAWPGAGRLLIAAGPGSRDAAGVQLWKTELQRLADDTGLEILICHLPPATTRWNRIEHRLVSLVGQDWRGRPPVRHEAVVNVVADAGGARPRGGADRGKSAAGPARPGAAGADAGAGYARLPGEWNYRIVPRARAEAPR
jgi:hypothetical protein